MKIFLGLSSCLLLVLPVAVRAQVLTEETTPRLVLSHFIAAMLDDDFPGMLKWTLPVSADDKNLADLAKERIRVKHLLNDLATTKFGAAGANAVESARYPGSVGDMVSQALQAVTAAGEFTQEGDVGMLTVKPREGDRFPAGPIYFQRIKGDWKLDLSRFLGIRNDGLTGTARKEANLNKSVVLRAELTAIAHVIERTRANEFSSAMELQEALEIAMNKGRLNNVY